MPETREAVLNRAIENTSDLIVQLQGDLRRTNQLKTVLETLLKLELGEPDFHEGEYVQCIVGHFKGRSGYVLNQDGAYTGELSVKLEPDDTVVGFGDVSELVKIPTAIVHVADALVRINGFGFAGDDFVPQIDHRAWEMLRISDVQLEEILEEVGEQLEDAGDFLSDMTESMSNQ